MKTAGCCTVAQSHCCTTLNILTLLSHTAQRHIQNALLRFQCDNAYAMHYNITYVKTNYPSYEYMFQLSVL
jgi:hypothetical protein